MKILRPVLLALFSFVLLCAATAYLKPQNAPEPPQTHVVQLPEESAAEKEAVLPETPERNRPIETASAQPQTTEAKSPQSDRPPDAEVRANRPDAQVQAPESPEKKVNASADGSKRKEPEKQSQPHSSRLALVIDDFGYNLKMAQKILRLKIPATWAIIPGTPHDREIASLAAEHEQPFLLHVPMQAMSDTTGRPGYAVGVDTPEEKIAAYLQALREKYPDAIGVNNHRGSKATSDAATMRRFMKEFASTGWGFLDSRTIAKTIAKKVALEYDIPVVQNSVFIDGTSDLPTMKKQFSAALRAAKKRGSAVAICHAREKTLPFLVYLSENSFAPVDLVTVDELWKEQQARN